MSRNKWIAVTIALTVVAVLVYRTVLRGDRSVADGPPSTGPAEVSSADDLTRESSLQEVLELAGSALQHMSDTLVDYTARFVKQETDSQGVLQESTEMSLKIHSPLRNESDDAPLRVYLGFQLPESVKGREVIWAEDMHDGQLVVHEAGLLGLMTLRLDPNGMIAMRGQRYPITEIGLAKLVEKLIDRGQPDLGNPDIKVTITEKHQFDNLNTELIRVQKPRPDGTDNDFSLAEIVIDRSRQLVLSYRSYGWPESGDAPPLQESYAYHNLELNVGLTEEDFDPSNPEYRFP